MVAHTELNWTYTVTRCVYISKYGYLVKVFSVKKQKQCENGDLFFILILLFEQFYMAESDKIFYIYK